MNIDFKHIYKLGIKYSDFSLFFGGLFFDYLTLSEIDAVFDLVQQAFFLLLSLVLWVLVFEEDKLNRIKPKAFSHLLHQYGPMAFHFSLGALLGASSYYYFLSASLGPQFLFLLLILFMLIYNEFHQNRSLKKLETLSILSFCMLSFLTYFFPIITGSISPLNFYLACLVTVFSMGLLLGYRPVKGTQIGAWIVEKKRSMAFSVVPVLVVIIFHLLNWIPPVPLSCSFIGSYQRIVKNQGDYQLYFDRPWFRPFSKDQKIFNLSTTKQIYVFARVYAPGPISEKIYFRWMKKTGNDWSTTDQIPVELIGGRPLGYRAYSYKESLSPGLFKVSVETSRGKVLKQIVFIAEGEAMKGEAMKGEAMKGEAMKGEVDTGSDLSSLDNLDSLTM